MKKRTINGILLICTCLVTILSIWGPEALAKFKDRTVLDRIHILEVETAGEGYRYQLNPREKIHILSECLNSQTLPESEENKAIEADFANEYQDVTGSYAFVVNRRGPSGAEITEEEIYQTCNEEIARLKELSILPDSVKNVDAFNYEAVLYSAIDVLEPRNNVAVWKVSLSTDHRNADKGNRLLDAYIDADDGKIYELYARTQLSWNQIDPDAVMENWCAYMDISDVEPYETENPLLETTPYYKKYVITAGGGEKTIVTVGFYEGINELFLKISR